MNERIMVALSGGVDSSAAALLLKKAGFDVGGMIMRLNDTQGNEQDALDAKDVADALGIPFFETDMREVFRSNVVEDFVNSYSSGYIPNPCVVCNRFIKFSAFMDKARELGYDKMATGHYARVAFDEKTGRYILKKSADRRKDQSYMLYGLSQDQLARVAFPLGDYTKEEIRNLAENNGLITAKKRESQDICFVPDGDYAGYIERYLKKDFPDGDFVDSGGNILGRHKGIVRYTIGQRKGLGIAAGKPVFVYEKDMENNIVRVGDEELLFSKILIADNVNLVSVEKIDDPIQVKAKIRYSQNESGAVAQMLPDGRLRVEFDEPQRAITKGQAAVLYDGNIVVGGGRIVECM